MKKSIFKHIFLVFIAVFFIAIYLFSLRGTFGNPTVKQIDTTLKEWSQPFESSHERSPYAMMMSLYRDRKFDLSRDLADIGAPDVSYYKGKFYSFFPIGLPILLYPSFILGSNTIGSQLVSYATITLSALIASLLVYLISKRIFDLSTRLSVLTAIIFSFATTSWSYSVTIYQHLPSTMFLLLMLYATWSYGKFTRASWVWGAITWISYGILISMDYPNAILGLPIMFYFLFKSFRLAKKSTRSTMKIEFSPIIVITSLLFFLIVGGILTYNKVEYGSPTRFAQSFDRYERDKYYKLLSSIKTREEKQEVGVITKKTDSTLDETRIVNGAFILLFDNDKGIFFYSPVLLLSLVGFFFMFKQNNSRHKVESTLLLTLALTNLFVYASFGDPWGGWAYGPRYLIPAMSFLAIASVYWIQHLKNRVLHIIFLVLTYFLFIYSSGVALLGTLTTNIIPPKIEAIPLKLPYYNYLQNFEYLVKERTSNFIYNTYASSSMNLVQYFFIIWLSINTIALILLFVIPLIYKDELHPKH